MRAVVQRVTESRVKAHGKIIAETGRGIVVLIGFSPVESDRDYKYIVEKTVGLRIFEDENEKMNLSVNDIGGQILVVPNFTLYGDVRTGKRPGFTLSAPPDIARSMFDRLKNEYHNAYRPEKLAFGEFQAEMKVDIQNDGPVTIILDSGKLL